MGVYVVMIDIINNPLHDISRVEVTIYLCALARRDRCVGVIATFPCSTFSAARFAKLKDSRRIVGAGPRVVRSFPDHVGGVPLPDGEPTLGVIIHNSIILNGLRVMGAAAAHGGFGLVENPPPRRDGMLIRGRSLTIEGRSQHASLFDYEPFMTYSDAHAMLDSVFDQCKLGAASQKTTVFRGSPVLHVFHRVALWGSRL